MKESDMMDLFEMMKNAQGGQAAANFAKQFGMSEETVQDVMKAFMPAFATGLKDQASDPMGFSSLMGALKDNPMAAYYEDSLKAFSPDGQTAGQEALHQLFGSKGMIRAVTEQVASMTGVGVETTQKMFPVMATLFMGGMAREMTAGPFREAMDAFLKGFARGRPGDNPMDPMGLLSGNNPYAKAMEAFMGGFGGAGAGKAKAEPEEKAAGASDDPMQQGFRMFTDMISAGQQIQEEQIRTMEKVMAGYRKSGDDD